ncbi:hypothetical protein WKH57_15265 [Niallia taxi]|uniref:hypothetical protein n=1 Tax=Niallia taxi TaxID=2499688 RepID=UPI003180A9B3
MYNLLKDERRVINAFKVEEEWELSTFEDVQLKIKILSDDSGNYYYKLSHFYVGTGKPAPKSSSLNICPTKSEALILAKNFMFYYYDEEDTGAVWYPNKEY